MISFTYRFALSRQWVAAVVAIAYLAASPAVSSAQTWTAASPGDFLTASNWGGTVPNAVDASSNIATNPTNAGNFTLDGSMTVGAFNYSNSQSRSLLGTGTLTLEKSSGNPEFNVENGSLTVDVAMAIPTTTKFQIDSASTISGIISGAGILQKRGSGTLTLSANNTYTGGTSIINGTLQLGNNDRLVNASRVSISTPGIFDLNSFSDTIGSLEGDGNITLGSGTLTTGGDNTSTAYSGVISGSGALTKSGSGIFTLSGANSYTGTTTILGGKLSGNSIANQGVSSSFGMGNFTLTGLGTLQYTGGSASTDRSVALSGSGQFDITNAATNLTITGSISGGALVKQGSGTLNLEGINNYNGSIYLADGTLSGNTIANNNVDSSFGRGLSFNIFSGATLQYTGSTASTNRLISLGFDGGVISVTNPGTTLTMSGVLSDIGGLTKTGAGVLRLDGDNTYAGNTTITQGTLRLGADERIPDGSAVTVASGATLDLSNATETIGSLAGAGNVVGSAGLYTGSDNSSTTFSGTISGAIYMSKFGSGTFTLSGLNSNAGEIVIAGGTLSGNTIANIGTNSSFGTGSLDSRFIFYGGTTLEYTGPSASTNRSIWLDQGGGVVSVTDTGATVDWNGAINGVGGLTKDGGGTLHLNGNNTYSGSTTINQGTLQVSSAGSIPDGSALTIASGATFDFDIGEFNTLAIGSLSGDGNLQLVSGALEVGYDNSSTTFSGTISGSVDGLLGKYGSGTLTLSGINSFSGPVGVGEGVLSGNTIGNIGVPSAFGTGVAAIPFYIEYGGTLEYTGPNASTNRPVLLQADGGAISVSNSETTLVLDGVVDGEEVEGDLTKSGPGLLHLSNPNNSYLGTTYINEGVLRGDAIADAGINSSFGRGDFAISNGAMLEYTGATASTDRTVALGSGGGAVVVESAAAVLTLTGQISGVGGLTKQGPGTLQLDADNNYEGSTILSQGILRLGDDERIPDGSAVTIASGATLDIGDNYESVGSLSGAGNLQLSAGGYSAIEVGHDNSSTTFSGNISGSDSSWLTKTGSGTFMLSGINSFSGHVEVVEGVLSGNTIGNIGVPSAFGTGVAAEALVIAYGGTLEYTGPNASTNRPVFLYVDDGAISVSNSETTLIWDGVISQEGNLTKLGAGTLQLNAVNTYEGTTTVAQGTLRLGNSERLTDGTAVTINGSGVFDLNNFNETVGSVTGSNSVALGSGTLTTGADNTSTTFSGVISGTGGLVKQGSGTMTLSGANTYSGLTTIAAGTLSGNTIGNDGVNSAFGTGDITILNGAVLEYRGTSASTNRSISTGFAPATIAVTNAATTLTLSAGNLTSSTGLIKTGAGTLSLAGSYSYSGGTTINAGTLAVNGSVPGPITVNAGGTLAGTGVVDQGDVTNGGRVTPGNSPGILVIDGDYHQSTNGVLEIEVGGLTVDPVVLHDQLQVSGAAEIAGLLEVPIVNGFVPALNDEITFLTAQGGVTGVFNSLVSPNLATVNPNVALEVIKHPTMNPTEVRLRFVAPSTETQFDTTVTEPARWSDQDSWTTETVPGTVNVIDLENAPGTTQRINVEDADALVHQLTVTGNNGTMIVGVTNGNFLSATVGTTVGNQAVIELDNGTLASPSVAIEDGGLLAGNGTVQANLTNSGGTLRPGFSVGHLDVKGNYEQETDGTLLVDVEGTQAGEWDTVEITGSVQLGGTLQIDVSTFINSSPGAEIPLITAGTLAGTFESVESVGNNNIYFKDSYDYDAGTMTLYQLNRGDMNGDTTTNTSDYDLFVFGLMNASISRYFAECNCDILPQQGGDFSGNGRLDFDDIPGFQNQLTGMGMSTAGLSAAFERYFNNVPEPSAAMLFFCGGSWLINCGRPRRLPRFHVAWH